VFPAPQAGKEWGVEPSWTNAQGKKVWATARMYTPLSPPLERRTATLAFRPKRRNRQPALTTRSPFGVKEKKAKHAVKITAVANLREAVQVDQRRGSAIALTYDKFKLGMTIDDQGPPENSPFRQMFETVNQFMKQVSSNAFQDARGNIVTDG